MIEKLKHLQNGDTVYLKSGTYRLDEPIIIKGKNITVIGEDNCHITGCKQLTPEIKSYNDRIKYFYVDSEVDGLTINGLKYTMSRCPKYDESIEILNGYSADCTSRERVKSWENPKGGYLHVLHKHLWGGYQYEITGKTDEGELTLTGGHQNNRQLGMHDTYRYVENIFECMTDGGEWYFNKEKMTVYFIPFDNADICEVEVISAVHLIEFRGCKNVTIKNIKFSKTARTFMKPYDTLLRSDWTIYREGSLYFTDSQDCTVETCDFNEIGSNAVFVDGDNENITVKGCIIKNIGASGVCFVGRTESVHSPYYSFDHPRSLKDISLESGPKSNGYPKNCRIEDCLITRIGRIEKQTAGVQISMAMGITVSHCSIYDVPRAGINISEGTFGGHIIENNDIFDTVKETGDHGSINAWGRDRFWALEDVPNDEVIKYALLDCIKINVITNNRIRCDKGWDIDLDDGSSNYHIKNNLCLNGGIKLREGFYRTVENNITVINSLHLHVWYPNSRDIIRENLVFEPYKPIYMDIPQWGDMFDYNILHDVNSAAACSADELSGISKSDRHSVKVCCNFKADQDGDFTNNAPYFHNFDMNNFGVISERLRKLAKTPEIPAIRH
ncbi:MAG: right-handed parallel beta-helix repeat-containing protein [Eubacteriales bacterium]